MTTNRDIIQDAYRDAQIIPRDEDISPLQGQTGLRKLNEMCSVWRADRILFDYIDQTSLNDTIPIPTDAESAVKSNLALDLLDDVGMEPTTGLLARAGRTKANLVRRSLLYVQRPATTDHMPQGQGNRGVANILTDS